MRTAWLSDFWFELRVEAETWAEQRSPWLRGALWLYLVYALLRHMGDPLYRSWFAGLTLVVHEGGHLLFMPFGRTMMLLGGSIMQLFVPALVASYLLLRQRDWFGASVGTSWLSFSSFELATYVGDANKGRLGLVGMGDNVIHDWDALLTQWHLLNQSDAFAMLIRVVGGALGVCSAGFGAWLLVLMYRHVRSRRA